MTTGNLDRRVDAMFLRDRIWSWGFVVALWLVLAFVFFSIASVVDDTAIRIALAVAALAVGLFNTASITAMVRHYAHDKQHIYATDIRHLDANRAARAAARGTVTAARQPAEGS
jgi:hypothetical protein